jgi:hypothetical protein
MDAEKIAAVFDIYVKRFNPDDVIVHLCRDTLGRTARHFLFSEVSLLEREELKQSLDLTVYLHEKAEEDMPFVTPLSFPHEDRGPSARDIEQHFMAMIPKMYVFIEEKRLEKCLRWLGFLWGCGMYRDEPYFQTAYFNEKIIRILEYRHYYSSEGRIDLSFVHLGMVQGLLWCSGAYSLEELKDHNKP